MSPASGKRALRTRPSESPRSVNRTPAADAFTDLVFEIFRLNGRILAAGEVLTDEFALTTARWQVLGSVGFAGPQTVAQIARNMGLQRQSVQRTVDLLTEEGCLALTDNPNHARAKLVVLTKMGEAKLAKITQRQHIWANRIVKGLPDRPIAHAVSTLREIRQRLENDEA